jgi:NO-binding membrane sensor protein with MHYT domain
MNPAVVSNYDMKYVILSFVLACFGSFVALSSASRLIGPDKRVNRFELLLATLALGGIGVWTMHFIGMVALKLDLRVGYSLSETLISLLVVCLATGFSLAYVAKAPANVGRLLTAGVTLGLGVGVMHYLGMYGMRFGGYIDWSIPVVAVSILIAVVAATAALWLAFNTKFLLVRMIAALVMGVAVCTMHYTGMSAANFVCTTADRLSQPLGFGVITSSSLSVMVMLLSLGIAIVLSIDLFLQNVLIAHKQKQ